MQVLLEIMEFLVQKVILILHQYTEFRIISDQDSIRYQWITFFFPFRCTWSSWITWSVPVQERITLIHLHSSHTLTVLPGQPGSQGFRGEPGSPGAKGR